YYLRQPSPDVKWVSNHIGTASDRLRSAADGGPDAPQVLVDVVDEDPADDLLDAHRRHPREHGAGLSHLDVAEAAHDGGRRRSVLLVERSEERRVGKECRFGMVL